MAEDEKYMNKEEEKAFFERIRLAKKAVGKKKNFELYGVGDAAKLKEYDALIEDGEKAMAEIPQWYGDLASSLVSNYYGKGATFEDLMQEAMSVMYSAAAEYDPEKSRFTTYVTSLIKSRLATVVEADGLLQESGYVKKCRKKYEAAIEALKEQGVDKPTDEQILNESGLTAAKLKVVTDMMKKGPSTNVLSLDAAMESDDDDGQLLDIVAADTDVVAAVLESVSKELLNKAIDEHLTFEEEVVIRDRYAMNREKTVISREDIAKKLDCSSVTVKRLERSAYRKLAAVPELKGLV